MSTAVRGRGASWGAVLLAGVCAAQCGCLVISWDWSGRKGESTAVCRSTAYAAYEADVATVRQACRHALRGRDLKMANDSQDGGVALLEGANGEREKVAIELKQEGPSSSRTGPRTVVSVRMTTTGDGTESRELLQQIDAYLAGAQAAATTPSSTPTVLPASATEP